MRRIVVAIDGPAGAGKSTASRALAQRLGYGYVDTGAMYRVVGVLARGARARARRRRRARRVSSARCRFELRDGGTALRGRRARRLARRSGAPTPGELASRCRRVPVVRERLVALQRALGAGGRRGDGGARHRHRRVPGRAGEALPDRRRRRSGRGGARRSSARAARRSTRRRWRARSRRATAATAGARTSPLRPAGDARASSTPRHLGLDEVVERMAERACRAPFGLASLEKRRYGLPVAPRADFRPQGVPA